MTPEPDTERVATLSPEEALAMLGDETRLQILQTLGEANEPLAFAELYDRNQCDRSSNFSYHLGKLMDHFVHETDDGYVIRQAGRRVIEAVLAETPAGDTVLQRTQIDRPCVLCGAPIEVSYYRAHLGVYCTECGGVRDETSSTADGRAVETTDVLGYLDLPQAGVGNRTAAEVLHAAQFWTTSEAIALARDICPRCSASVDKSLEICENHDASAGHCDQCGQRFGVVLHHNCANCIFSVNSPFGTYLLDNADLIRFMIEHEIDPLAVPGFHITALDETVLSTDPFEARFTFTVEDDVLTLTVDDDLSVVDVTRTEQSDMQVRDQPR